MNSFQWHALHVSLQYYIKIVYKAVYIRLGFILPILATTKEGSRL